MSVVSVLTLQEVQEVQVELQMLRVQRQRPLLIMHQVAVAAVVAVLPHQELRVQEARVVLSH